MSATLPVTPTQFRELLPEFQSQDQYPDLLVTQYLTVAAAQLNPTRWADMLTMGICWFTGHYLVLMRRAMLDAANGVPGEQAGPVASKSVGGLSKSMDTGMASEANAGHWNATQYGRLYLSWARMAGAGGDIVGIGNAPPFSGPPYNGPIVFGS